MKTEVLLIGGRSGVGKSTVGWEISRQLQEAQCPHCFIEGDNLDQIYPAPPEDPVREKITEANLRAMWSNFAALGQTRLIYTNTVSVLSLSSMQRALGDITCFGILLTASDGTAEQRLKAREIGSGLQWHVERSRRAARRLDENAPDWVKRVKTDGRSTKDIAAEIIAHTGWLLESD